MRDAVTSLGESSTAAYRRGDLADLVYADDALLLASCDHYLQEFLGRVAGAGRLYGVELHWDKFQLLQVQCHASISTAPKQGIDYLGTVLSHGGLPGHELGRRIGMAKADFLNLQKVWKHSSLHWTRKVQIFKALIESKVMYSLSCLCLSAVERRRLDGCHSRCLRCILGIPPVFFLFRGYPMLKFDVGPAVMQPQTCYYNISSIFWKGLQKCVSILSSPEPCSLSPMRT